jgi:hypothetical protein
MTCTIDRRFLMIFLTSGLVLMSTQAAERTDASLQKCIENKNAKARLACFDATAPLAVAELKALSAAESARASEHERRKVDSADAERKDQQRLIRESIRELRKFTTATEVGINK